MYFLNFTYRVRCFRVPSMSSNTLGGYAYPRLNTSGLEPYMNHASSQNMRMPLSERDNLTEPYLP